MPSYIKILQPQAGTNLVTNPSVEFATTGWTAVGGSIARNSALQAKGAYSLAVTPTATTTDGVYFTTSTLTAAAYTASVWVRGVAGVPYRMYFATTVPVIVGTPTTFTGTGQWQYVTVTATTTAAVHRIYVVKNASASTGVFYVDGLQVELGSTATTYIDGDQDGCYWTGEPHNSTSSRIAGDTNGGQWLDLADDLQHNLIEFQGMGMPPVQVAAQTYALLPGAYYQRSIARPRLMQLAVLASGTSWQNLHFRRNLLLEAIQPSRSGMPQPITLRYDGAGSINTIRAVYDSGMEFGRRDGFTETYGLRMVAHDPYWYGELDEGTIINALTSEVSNSIAQRNYTTGQWGSTGVSNGPNVSGSVFAVTQWNGSVYIGGDFTTVDGTTTNRTAVYSDGRYGTMRTGMNSTVFAMVVNQGGTVYAGGTFTTAGGTTANYVAQWANGTWGTMLLGIQNTAGQGSQVNALALSRDGTLYVGGTFGLAGGTTTRNIAFWNGAAWGTISNGVNGQVLGLDVSPSGTLYACGNFTQANGTTANYVAYWDKTNWGTMAGGQDAIVRTIKAGPDGFIYTGGDFVTPAAAIGSFGLARWNGQSWESLWAQGTPTLIGEAVYALHFDANNTLYAGGLLPLSRITGRRFSSLIFWTGASWIQEVDFDALTRYVFAITNTPGNNTLYVGGGFTFVNANTSITVVNDGTAPAEPIIRIRNTAAPQSVTRITNWTTGQSIFLNLVVGRNEIIYIDTRAGRVSMFSTWRGNVISSLLSGSELAGFALVPGTNYITSQPEGGGIAIDLYFRARNWSADAV